MAMIANKGYLALVLHAHLPFVKHPEYSDPFEEDWLYEAITETYVPLIEVFENLVRDRVDFRITMSITPPLMEMLSDPFLQDRYVKKLEKLIELSEKEVYRTKNTKFHDLAIYYEKEFKKIYDIYVNKYNRNILKAFSLYQKMGYVEIITCGATHGFFPLMEVMHKQSVKAQVRVAVNNYMKHMSVMPRGIWLPESGYYPGDDEILAKEGIKYFFVEAHGILYGQPRAKYGVFSPVYTPNGVAAFGRDPESSKQVWSAKEGYPGDFNYREFYRDIGYDLPYEYIKPYIHESGQRKNVGIKYHKITGADVDLGKKDIYNVEAAMQKAAEHAGNFMFNRQKQAEFLFDVFGRKRKPIIVAPYDAELFGHWWYEGPKFIEFLARKMYYDQDDLKMITPYEYLTLYPENQEIKLNMSSWGWKGYNEFWLNGTNDWIYRHLHKLAEKMVEVANNYDYTDNQLQNRALNQLAREILLAQSSDWAFIMTTGTVPQYATRRTIEHISNFNKLYKQIKTNSIDESFLSQLENKDSIFSEIDFRVYRDE